jgi:hypothetical protein
MATTKIGSGTNTEVYLVQTVNGASDTNVTVEVTHGLKRKPDFVIVSPLAKGTTSYSGHQVKYTGTIGTDAILDASDTVFRLFAPSASTTYASIVLVGIRHSIIK